MPEFDSLLKGAIAFVTDGRGDPVGTAFFIAVPSEDGERHQYVVTAAHVVEGYEEDTYVRVRLRSGGCSDLKLSRWATHSDRQVDAAVSPIELSPIEFDYSTLRLPWYRDGSFVSVYGWEPGDGSDVYYIGLLGGVPTMGENGIPMVRSGTLGAWEQAGVPWRDASAPRGALTTRTAPVAHLIDVHSHAGFSGSPCFAHELHFRGEDFADGVNHGTIGRAVRIGLMRKDRLVLIGLISGHFPHPEKAVTATGEQLRVNINAGVGVVTPARYIAEILESDEWLVEDRARREAEAS